MVRFGHLYPRGSTGPAYTDQVHVPREQAELAHEALPLLLRLRTRLRLPALGWGQPAAAHGPSPRAPRHDG